MTNSSQPLRLVTGHDSDGNSIVVSHGPVPNVITPIPGARLYEMWRTPDCPVPVDNGPDLTVGNNNLQPGSRGTVFRVCDIPPDPEEGSAEGHGQHEAFFSNLGDVHASTGSETAPHPMMHRTETVDYGVVLDGEITLVLDKSETVLGPGSVVIQRGTNHAWANRSGRVCRMLFVLIDGQYALPE